MARTILRRTGLVLAVLIGLFAILVLWPVRTAPVPSTARTLVIDNVRVIDVEAGKAGSPTAVTVRNGTIAAIGAPPTDPKAQLVDGQGGFLIPGLWDMHVHTFQVSPQMHFPLWIANGVTNVRDMMDCPGESDSMIACVGNKREWNRQIDAGELSAPRIVEVASFYLESPDISAADAAILVDRYAARGLDAVKVYNRLSPAAYVAAAKAAKANNVRLVGHLPQAVDLETAISQGQTSFEHAHLFARECSGRARDWRERAMEGMSPTERVEAFIQARDSRRCTVLMARMAGTGSWFVPTHVTREEDARAGDPSFFEDPRLDHLDPLSRWAYRDDLGGTTSDFPGHRGKQALRDYFALGMQLTGEAHARGVGVLVGTDTALGGFRYHDELQHLTRAGLSPADVLRAATLEAARYAEEEGTTGSITVGKRADLVLLAANPLEDIANTRRINAVIHGGRLYDRAALDSQLAFVKRQARAPHMWVKLVWGFLRSSVSAEL